MIAQCMAILAPDRLLSLTSIMSTTGNRQLPKPKSSVTLQLLKQAPSEQEAYLAHALKIWRLFHGDTYPFEEKRVADNLIKARNRSFYPAGIKRQLSAIIASPDRTSDLGKVSVPSLIVHGDYDPLVPVECGLATAKAIPGARCKIFEGMGHTLPSQLWPDMIDEIDQIANS
jgi:pimeloyl-ACP methyl ester carboxylesterase